MKIRRCLLLIMLGFCLVPVPGSGNFLAQDSSVSATEVRFEGNESISTQQLLSLLGRSLKGNEYPIKNLDVGLMQVEKEYEDEGFLQAKVGPPDIRIQTIKGEKISVIRIPVIEGPRYSVGKVAVKRAQVLAPASILQMCPLQEGQIYNRNKISLWEAKIEEAYQSMGYIRANCVAREALNEINKTVDCMLECNEGKPYIVGKINIVADESIDRMQFKRRLLLSERGIFNPEMLSLTIQYLNRMRLYKPISNSDVEIGIDDAKGTVDLTLHLFLRGR